MSYHDDRENTADGFLKKRHVKKKIKKIRRWGCFF